MLGANRVRVGVRVVIRVGCKVRVLRQIGASASCVQCIVMDGLLHVIPQGLHALYDIYMEHMPQG